MQLKTAIKRNKEQLLYIGAASSYICITRGDVAENHLKYWDDKKISMGNTGSWGNRVPKRKRVDGPYLKRKVLNIYNRIGGGVAIIIEGDEAGRFWFEHEYNEYWEKAQNGRSKGKSRRGKT